MQLRMKELRVARGLGQKEVASAIGIPTRTYGSYERGERSISLEDAARIADVLVCTLDELVGREWPRPEYVDERQEALNAHWDTFNDDARDAVLRVVEGMSHDPHARIEKDGREHPAAREALGA